MITKQQQHGAVLIVCLVTLVVMTLLAVASINHSTINLKIIDNVQSQRENESVVANAMETVVSDIAYFNIPSTTPTVTVDGKDVAISARTCLQASPAKGYSAAWALVPEDTHWQYTASVTDSNTGAQTAMTQGVEIRLAAGGCP